MDGKHTLGKEVRGARHQKQKLDALLRSLTVSSNPRSVFPVTGLNAQGLHKELMLQMEDISNCKILKPSVSSGFPHLLHAQDLQVVTEF